MTVRATSTATGIKLGAPLSIPLVQQFSSSTLAIPVSLAANAPTNTVVTINVHAAGDFTCNPGGVDISLMALTGANPMAPQPLDDATVLASRPAAEGVIAMQLAPTKSLRAFDVQACILNDTP